MGSLTLPTAGTVFFDTQIAIYSVEKHSVYAAVIRPLWIAAQAGTLQAAASELIISECLVRPLRNGDKLLERDFEAFWGSGHIGLEPISNAVLRKSAELRAKYKSLRTPDAIHAATAILRGAALLVTNDYNFQQVSELKSVFLNDLLKP